MNNKRETLKKVAGVSAVAALAPTSWTKPILSSVVLPAHAQTSENQAPTISGVSCTFDTTTLQVGSVITIEATIEDSDNPIADITWGILNSNSGLIVTGEGQFVTTTYTVVDGDLGNLTIELEAFDGTGNRTAVTVCDDAVLSFGLLEIVEGSFNIIEENGSLILNSISGRVTSSNNIFPSGVFSGILLDIELTLGPSVSLTLVVARLDEFGNFSSAQSIVLDGRIDRGDSSVTGRFRFNFPNEVGNSSLSHTAEIPI